MIKIIAGIMFLLFAGMIALSDLPNTTTAFAIFMVSAWAMFGWAESSRP